MTDLLLDRAWATGLFEGEGCVFYGRTTACTLKLGMTDEDVVRRFASLVKGRVYGPRPLPSGKSVWECHVQGWENVQEVFDWMRPWLGKRRLGQFAAVFEQRPNPPAISCGSDPNIATYASYRRHIRRGEPTCVTCRKQAALMSRRRAA